MDGQALVGAGGAATNPTSSVGARTNILNGPLKRRRSETTGVLDSSPSSIIDDEHSHHHEHERKRQPGVKRACNECRQQKLRCDVIQEPFTSCSRCNRLKLECKIESNFKRIGKRSKHAEMERELERLRRNMERARQQGYTFDDDDEIHSQLQSPIANNVYSHSRTHSVMKQEDVVNSLLHLKQGGAFPLPRFHELGPVRLTDEIVNMLFQEFFTHYHTFLPFLNPSQTPDQYKQQHELLFWSIISVASRRFHQQNSLIDSLSEPLTSLLWKTIGEVPTNYHVVKALCLLCTWPLPTSTTTSDPTHILCGVMMKSATGIGLHRPSHTQDFSRVSVELDKDQLHDRVVTWAVCNIVAQTIGTGYGQPASTLYDWTLAVRPGDQGPFTLSPDLEARLQIEKFCDKVSKEMYSNAHDPRGVAGDEHRAMLTRVYKRDFSELQASVLSQQPLSVVVRLHLKAAQLHFRLAAFFDSMTTTGYMDDLMGLWRATTAFLDTVMEDEPASPGSNISNILPYSTNYIGQMLVAAGFALLKMMRSFFAKNIDFDRGKKLFHHTVRAIKATSVLPNDLNWKLAELMVQMWTGSGLDSYDNNSVKREVEFDLPMSIDDTLQLKVRCRHSMSLVFDSIWRWREEYQTLGRGAFEGFKHMNNDSGNESAASSTAPLDNTLMTASHGLQQPGLLGTSNGSLTPGATGMSAVSAGMLGGSMTAFGESSAPYDLWDPNHWVLDNLLDFNFNYPMQTIEGA